MCRFFFSCNRKEISNSYHPVSSCSATKAGVEDTEIFPAVNAWNKDQFLLDTNQVILKAMKTYGLILADIGSNMYVSGAPDERWNNDELRELLQVKASDFEVVKFNN